MRTARSPHDSLPFCPRELSAPLLTLTVRHVHTQTAPRPAALRLRPVGSRPAPESLLPPRASTPPRGRRSFTRSRSTRPCGGLSPLQSSRRAVSGGNGELCVCKHHEWGGRCWIHFERAPRRADRPPFDASVSCPGLSRCLDAGRHAGPAAHPPPIPAACSSVDGVARGPRGPFAEGS